MTFSGDELRTGLAVVAIGVSIASLYFSRRSWFQANRPIVTAFVAEHDAGNNACTFNLVIANSGSRPATNIRLHASESVIESLLEADTTQDRKESIRQCFSASAMIPLLRNGEEIETAFGAFTTDVSNGPWLKYDKQIQIEVSYQDLEGRKYRSRLPLKIFVRNGFGGSVWIDRS
jgi:hypothetical protein